MIQGLQTGGSNEQETTRRSVPGREVADRAGRHQERERLGDVPASQRCSGVSRGQAALEVVMECHFPFDRDLIGRYAPLEEVRKFLHVLELHESEGILRTKRWGDPERFQAAIRDVLQVLPHVGWGKPTHTKTQDIVREGHLALHSVFQHGGYALLHVFVKQGRLLLSYGAAHFQRELDVSTLVTEDPVGARSKPV